MVVGEIVINTKANNKGLNQDLKETEKIIKQFDDRNKVKIVC